MNLIAVGVAGDEVRRQKHGAKTTFNRVFEIHVDAPPQSLPTQLHAGELRIIGTVSSLESLVDAVRAAVALAGKTPVTLLSATELLRLKVPVAKSAAALKDAGLSAIVQLHIDAVADPENVTRDLRTAGLPILTLAVDVLSEEHRLSICHAAARLQATVGGFHAFAPLPRTMSAARPTTGYDDVKMVAAARTLVSDIPSIQVDWALYGPKLAQVALTVGANDVDNVAAVDPGVLGTRRSPLEEIRGNIKAAALEAVERDGLFRIVGS